jgi:hypothetical protein
MLALEAVICVRLYLFNPLLDVVAYVKDILDAKWVRLGQIPKDQCTASSSNAIEMTSSPKPKMVYVYESTNTPYALSPALAFTDLLTKLVPLVADPFLTDTFSLSDPTLLFEVLGPFDPFCN